jgi:hypothetical protein
MLQLASPMPAMIVISSHVPIVNAAPASQNPTPKKKPSRILIPRSLDFT